MLMQNVYYWPDGRWTTEEGDVEILEESHGDFRGVLVVAKSASRDYIDQAVMGQFDIASAAAAPPEIPAIA